MNMLKYFSNSFSQIDPEIPVRVAARKEGAEGSGATVVQINFFLMGVVSTVSCFINGGPDLGPLNTTLPLLSMNLRRMKNIHFCPKGPASAKFYSK